ncbi:hypothetical protein [Legionella gresilensis]|uniref:hypothetical protein n=1 Tax=Legionella gresilensis TaxID=91823 RepID=UPI001041B730|nr:hypothetical protein [Legionella gresilensis]
MNYEQFQLWLQGYLDLSYESSLSPKQVKIIYHHALLVKVLNKDRNEAINGVVDILNELKNEKKDIPREKLSLLGPK